MATARTWTTWSADRAQQIESAGIPCTIGWRGAGHRRTRALTIVDEGNREGLEITVGVSLPSRRVVRVLEDLVTEHGSPVAVRVDNGPEVLAQPFVDWAAAHGAAIHYIQPGSPIRMLLSSGLIAAIGRKCATRTCSTRLGAPGDDRYLAPHLQPRAASR